MAWPGNQYIVLSTGGAFSVDLSGAAGKTFNVEWLNVDADTTVSGSSNSRWLCQVNPLRRHHWHGSSPLILEIDFKVCEH